MKKQVKVSPEELSEQQRVEAERRAVRAAEAAAAKSKRLAERQAYKDEMTAFARSLKFASVVPDQRTAKAEADAWVRNEIGCGFLSCQEDLDQWVREVFAFNPGHEFEWAEGEMKIAAKLEIYSHMVADLKQGHSPLEVVSEFIEGLTRRLLSNEWRANSSSAAHNAMQSARAEQFSQILRYELREWKRALDQAVTKDLLTPVQQTATAAN